MENNYFIPGFVVGLLIGTGVMFLAAEADEEAWQDNAIEHGYAEHDQVTGEWQWKENNSNETK